MRSLHRAWDCSVLSPPRFRFAGYAAPTAEENGVLHGSHEAERNALTATKLRLEREVAALKQQTERSDLRR